MHVTGLVLFSSLCLLATALCVVKGTSSCTESAPSFNGSTSGTQHQLLANTTHGFTAVLRNYTFNCEGTLAQWNIRWEFSYLAECEIVFDFHVLRPNRTDGECVFVSVGLNRMTVQRDRDNLNQSRRGITFNVSKNDQIRVKPGDIVGLDVYFNRSVQCRRRPRARMAIMESTDKDEYSSVYYRRWRLSSEPTTINETQRAFPGCSNSPEGGGTAEQGYKSYSGAPFINAIVEQNTVVWDNSNEEEFSTNSPQTTENRRKWISIGASVCSVIFTLALVSLTVGVGYIVLQRHRRGNDTVTKEYVNSATSQSPREKSKFSAQKEQFPADIQQAPSQAAQRNTPTHYKRKDTTSLPTQSLTSSPSHTATNGKAAVKKKPPIIPRCVMSNNTAYGSPSLANTHTTEELSAASVGPSNEDISQTDTGRYEGNRYILEDRVYEVPEDWDISHKW